MAKIGAEYLKSDLKRSVDVAAALGVVGASLAPGIAVGGLFGGENVRRNPAKLALAGIAPWLAIAVATCV